MFKTITTRFATTCRRCGQPVQIGSRVRWAKGRGTYHLSAECPKGKDAQPETEPEAWARRAEEGWGPGGY